MRPRWKGARVIPIFRWKGCLAHNSRENFASRAWVDSEPLRLLAPASGLSSVVLVAHAACLPAFLPTTGICARRRARYSKVRKSKRGRARSNVLANGRSRKFIVNLHVLRACQRRVVVVDLEEFERVSATIWTPWRARRLVPGVDDEHLSDLSRLAVDMTRRQRTISRQAPAVWSFPGATGITCFTPERSDSNATASRRPVKCSASQIGGEKSQSGVEGARSEKCSARGGGTVYLHPSATWLRVVARHRPSCHSGNSSSHGGP